MARVSVVPQPVASAGIAPVFTTINAADYATFPAGGRRLVLLRNTGGASTTVTAVTAYSLGGLTVNDKALVLAAGETRVYAFNNVALWGDYSETPPFITINPGGASFQIAVLEHGGF